MMCEHCFEDMTRNPQWRLKNMEDRCKDQPNHWVHNIREYKEPTSSHLCSWNNACYRRHKTFDELEANGTKEMTYAYDDAQNRYSERDMRAITKHNRRYEGSGGDGKRQRR